MDRGDSITEDINRDLIPSWRRCLSIENSIDCSSSVILTVTRYVLQQIILCVWRREVKSKWIHVLKYWNMKFCNKMSGSPDEWHHHIIVCRIYMKELSVWHVCLLKIQYPSSSAIKKHGPRRVVYLYLTTSDQIWESLHFFIIYKSRYILDISKAQSR